MNKIIHYKSYDLKSMRKPNLIAVTHANDVDTQFIELHLLDGCNPVTLSASYTYTALMVNRDTQALIDDSVSCTLNESGNVEIPIDNLHTQGGMNLLIELTITDSDGNQVLVTPFPLTVHVNPSILDDAQVTPESQGTVPELLEEAKEALENAKDYEKLDNLPAINGHTLIGDQAAEDLDLQGKLTAGENITIDEDGTISAEGGSEIVSGTVNQNGTITFTDSGGNIFTTTGESVIGPQGIQGAAGPQGPQGEQGVKGDPGATGADGFSPTATVTQTQSGATVTIGSTNLDKLTAEQKAIATNKNWTLA